MAAHPCNLWHSRDNNQNLSKFHTWEFNHKKDQKLLKNKTYKIRLKLRPLNWWDKHWEVECLPPESDECVQKKEILDESKK